jgi:hypothetical protein
LRAGEIRRHILRRSSPFFNGLLNILMMLAERSTHNRVQIFRLRAAIAVNNGN